MRQPAKARIAALESENHDLMARLQGIAALAGGSAAVPETVTPPPPVTATAAVRRAPTSAPPRAADGELHPAARKLLIAAAQHAPACFTWGQLATLAGLKPSGGHFNAGRKSLRDAGYIAETGGLVAATQAGLKDAGEVPPSPSTPSERLALWCDRLPSPAPEMLRTLAARGEDYMHADELAVTIGKKPSGGHWNSGIAILRNNGLIEADGRRYRASTLLR